VYTVNGTEWPYNVLNCHYETTHSFTRIAVNIRSILQSELELTREGVKSWSRIQVDLGYELVQYEVLLKTVQQ